MPIQKARVGEVYGAYKMLERIKVGGHQEAFLTITNVSRHIQPSVDALVEFYDADPTKLVGKTPDDVGHVLFPLHEDVPEVVQIMRVISAFHDRIDETFGDSDELHYEERFVYAAGETIGITYDGVAMRVRLHKNFTLKVSSKDQGSYTSTVVYPNIAGLWSGKGSSPEAAISDQWHELTRQYFLSSISFDDGISSLLTVLENVRPEDIVQQSILSQQRSP